MWKSNWQETKKNYTDWWNHKGLVIGTWWAMTPTDQPRYETVPAPARQETWVEYCTDPVVRAARNHYNLSRAVFPGESLPVSYTDLGPGSLALYCGCEPKIAEDTYTVWFVPAFEHVENPETLPPIAFAPDNKWWKLAEDTIRECKKISNDNYLVGIPDLFDALDVLSSLRGAQTMLFDLVERPEWVDQKLKEIHAVWTEVFERMYQLSKLPDGSSCYGPFCLWGPGKTTLMQCDASAMISPEMFARFAVPYLKQQCEKAEYTMYHLDGTQAIVHLDQVLQIERLKAVEWSPQAGLEGPGNPRWFDLYRKILDAGKSVQVCGASPDEIVPVLDAIGGKGVYFVTAFKSEKQAEELLKQVEPYRK